MNNPKYFSITYDMSKLSDDEQKAVIDEASSLFSSQKAVCAGWESGDIVNNGWISVDDELPDNESEVLGYRESFKYGDLIYHCVFKDGLFLDRLTFNPAGKSKITHWQYLPQPPKELKNE